MQTVPPDQDFSPGDSQSEKEMVKRVVLSIFLILALPLTLRTTYASYSAVEAILGPAIAKITTNVADYPHGKVPRYEKLEITLALTATYSNPFDPDEIRVDGYFISPGHTTLVHPGFYYQGYQVSGMGGIETYTPVGTPIWQVRFTPSEVGTYQYYVRVTDRSGTVNSSLDSFEVIDSSNPGFIRVSKKNSRYFEFDSGAPFMGVGLNIAWWQDEHKRLATYEYYLSRMNEYKANLARVWMTNSGKDQNWILSIQDKKLGSDYNLEEAWAFDSILDMAQQKGVHFLLTLDDVNQYTYNWPDNVYNSAAGGPCSYQSAIFTNLEAKKYQKQIFRYIIARWGYSPSILSWELFNEIDELQWSDPDHWNRQDMINWHQEMAQYIKSIDAYQHLVNTSTGSFKTHPDLYEALSGMDFAQIHFYYVPGCCDYAPSDPTGRDMADLTRYYSHLVYDSVTSKPSLIGEWGLLNQNWIDSPYLNTDDKGVHLHNGLWSSLMSGMAATGLSWHWGYHQEHDPAWWQHYRAIANYFKDVNVSNLTTMKPVNVDFSLPDGSDDRPDAFSSTNGSLRAMGLRSGNWVYAWIQNTENTWWNDVHKIAPSPQSGTITVHDMTPGASYAIEWWDTYTRTQQMIASDNLTAQDNGSILIRINNLENDVAIKVRPVVHPQIWLPIILKGA